MSASNNRPNSDSQLCRHDAMDVDQASFGGLETNTRNDTVNDDVISSVQALLSQEKPNRDREM